MAEWVAEHVGCDEVVLVVSPKNPLKADDSLAPELNRFEMAELACARSRFPERIKPSVIEFLLEKPSYTIDTLRYLSRNYGGQMRFRYCWAPTSSRSSNAGETTARSSTAIRCWSTRAGASRRRNTSTGSPF